jgi:hypothetical protein
MDWTWEGIGNTRRLTTRRFDDIARDVIELP